MIGSKTGGTSIEDIAAADPTAIIRTPVDIIQGINPAEAEKMATEMGFTGAQAKEAVTWQVTFHFEVVKKTKLKKSFGKKGLASSKQPSIFDQLHFDQKINLQISSWSP